MIVATTNQIAGKRIVRTLGLARGNTIRARHIGKGHHGAAAEPGRW